MTPMKTTRFPLVSALAVSGALLAATLSPAGADESPRATASDAWLTIPQVHDRLQAAGYRRIEEIERERGAYEVRATDRDGRRVKLYVDGRSGELIDRRSRSEWRDDAGRGRRADADCNQRRCRDDLPPSAR